MFSKIEDSRLILVFIKSLEWTTKWLCPKILTAGVNQCYKKKQKLSFKSNPYTGLPTKNETSETTVRNLYCPFLYIHEPCDFALVFFFVQWLKRPLYDYIQGRGLIIFQWLKVVFTVSYLVGSPVRNNGL